MWTRHPLSAVWFRGGGADDADDARSEMPMEDDETILRGEEGISSHGASSAVRCDRDPGAVRLAAVEPDDAVAGEARCCYNSIPGSYHRTEEKGVWHRPATDTNTCRRQEVVWITSQTRSGGAIWLHTVVLRWNADSLRRGKVSLFHPVPRCNRPESCRGAISPPPQYKNYTK